MDHSIKFEQGKALYKQAVEQLAQAYDLFREVDAVTYPSITTITKLEYMQQSLDFEQLCEDVAEHMKGE